MATITGLTAERMQEIIDGTIVDADIIGDHLILTKEDGSTIDTGVVKGDPGAPGAPASNLGKGSAFPGGATDGDLFVRTDQVGDPLYKFTDGAWAISAGGLSKVTAFPGAPTDGDVVVRTDLNGSPMYAYSTENGWEQQPRMGAVTVPSASVRRVGTQTVAANTDMTVSFTVADISTDTMWSAGSPTRLTIKTPGRYRINAIPGVFNQAPSWIGIYKNGVRIAMTGPGSAATYQPNLTVDTTCASGDYIELITHSTGSGLTIGDAADVTSQPQLQATWLGGPGQTVDERGVPAVKGYITAVQSIPNATWTAVAFTSEEFDTDGMHDLVTNTSRFTAKTPGIYEITGSVDWSSGVGIRYAEIRRNGASVNGGDVSRMAGSAGSDRDQVSARLLLAAGDYIELMVHQTNGSALNLAVGAALDMTLAATGKTVTPFTRVYRNAQSIPSGTNTAIGYDVEDVDNDSIHDTVTNNSRLVCRTAGTYAIMGSAVFGSSSGYISATIAKNGSAPSASGTRVAGTSQTSVLPIHDILELAVGDYVELLINQNSGGALVIETRLQMVKVGAPNAGQTGIDAVPSWQVLADAAMSNGWVNGGTARTDKIQYRKDRGRVQLQGSFGGGTNTNAVILFTLPVDYRPSRRQYIPVICSNLSVLNGHSPALVYIETDGTVHVYGTFSYTPDVNLDGTSFSL